MIRNVMKFVGIRSLLGAGHLVPESKRASFLRLELSKDIIRLWIEIICRAARMKP